MAKLFSSTQEAIMMILCAEEAAEFSSTLRAIGFTDEQRMHAFQVLALGLLARKGPTRNLEPFSKENLKNNLYFVATELDDFLDGIRERFNELSKELT